jgi:hypothetical protein
MCTLSHEAEKKGAQKCRGLKPKLRPWVEGTEAEKILRESREADNNNLQSPAPHMHAGGGGAHMHPPGDPSYCPAGL